MVEYRRLSQNWCFIFCVDQFIRKIFKYHPTHFWEFYTILSMGTAQTLVHLLLKQYFRQTLDEVSDTLRVVHVSILFIGQYWQSISYLQTRRQFVVGEAKKLHTIGPGPALPLGQLGGRLERSLQGAQNPLFSWFPCHSVLLWHVTGRKYWRTVSGQPWMGTHAKMRFK